ncbi:hypothetical protein [Halohasta salina]|uniref:hypothetical protein n=1 Tax=Halohasta salina TaxID=2961621 RepID=UPI0020A41C15|nr:hypothetical protein [Halohasta salina]
MRRTTQGGILVGCGVLFVIVWEIRSALGLLAGVDTNPQLYMLLTLAVVGLTAVALAIGLIGLRPEPPADEDAQ